MKICGRASLVGMTSIIRFILDIKDGKHGIVVWVWAITKHMLREGLTQMKDYLKTVRMLKSFTRDGGIGMRLEKRTRMLPNTSRMVMSSSFVMLMRCHYRLLKQYDNTRFRASDG